MKKSIMPIAAMMLAPVVNVHAEAIVHVNKQVMTPLVQSTSFKKKGNKYQFSFAKGKAMSPVRYKIIPLKITHKGAVKITTNKTKLSYDTYSNEACTKACQVNSPGQYYVKVTQKAYAIDLTDHHYACYKKATMTLYVTQISEDDFTLKPKTYAIFGGKPKIKISTAQGYLTLRSQKLNNQGKYVYDGTYTLTDSNGKKLNESVPSQSKIAVLKGDYYLIPDGLAAYRIKYTWHKAPTYANISKEKARLLSKSSTGIFYNDGKENRFYKVKLTANQALRVKISDMIPDQVAFLSYDKEKSQNLSYKSQRTGQTIVYTTDQLPAGTYYIQVTKKVSHPCGYLYTISLN